METIYKILDSLPEASQNEPDVLTTIIKVEGSSYRKEGASMLIKRNGPRIGFLSAGCLEEDLEARVGSSALFFNPERVAYDMSSEDDLSWGQGAGCNGILHILMEPITPLFLTHLLLLKKHLTAGHSVHLVRKMNLACSDVEYLFSVNNGMRFGNWTDDLNHIEEELQKRHRADRSNCSLFDIQESQYFFQSFYPKPRLILFGAGDDAIPLARLAAETGFSVLASDWRPGLCNPARFPRADQLLVGTPEEITAGIRFTHYDSVVILSHVFQKDQEFLKAIEKKEAGYIGILGSKTRTARLLEGCVLSEKIHSPVGLSIGADGPEEIAVSIIAQLIQLKRKLAVLHA
ncbi:XdhC family protein [Peribacillus kribbensis]|uniref:XdhC family protein n=1 Tax=Peribacillus kribbensis TaxID=356658 RepID=UPI0003FFFF24|nr:XdhC family protein [Peribacillus kribbensis]